MAVPYTDEYTRLFSTMQIKPSKLSEIDTVVKRINEAKVRYKAIEKATGVPWFFIGLIHHMEASNNFSKHLHNGDPLSARTTQVPAGRPAAGNPPFTFEQSAVDAIKYMGFDKVKDWSLPQMLYLLEKFNGFGYRILKQPINSPYLWSYSNHYTKGKYVKDGPGGYDPNAVSKQAGVAVILYRVLDKNNLLSKYINIAGGAAGLLLLVAAVFF